MKGVILGDDKANRLEEEKQFRSSPTAPTGGPILSHAADQLASFPVTVGDEDIATHPAIPQSNTLAAGSQPSREQLEREYDQRFTANAPYRTAVWHVLTTRFFSRWVPNDSVVLDLGCGWGEFINQIHAGKKYGMDLNPASASKLSNDVALLAQDCATTWPLADEKLDVVFTSNFFEHLPDQESLARTLGEAFRCLKRGGRIICLGPNIRYLGGRYWDFWDHYLALDETSLKGVLEKVGFKLEHLIDRFLPYTMSQGLTPPLIFLRAYLRLPFLWRIFGHQFCLIARKPA